MVALGKVVLVVSRLCELADDGGRSLEAEEGVE